MEFLNVPVELLALLLLVAIIAGFLDTLAGGGGLITLPALILSGVPPLAALGTNKLQGSMGTATSSFMMLKCKKISWHNMKYLMLTALLGSTVGTIAVQFINTELLTFIIPIVLLCIAVYFLISPTPPATQRTATLSSKTYRDVVVPVIGAYDGMFGPGTGSFFALAGVVGRGQDLLSATAIAKPLNFATNIASLVVFLIAGQVAWVIGGVMMVGQAIGAWLGSHCLLSIHPTYLRALIVLMCTGMLVKYADAMGWISVF